MATIIGSLLSSSILALFITPIVEFFSKRNHRKIKHSIIKTKLYSPIIQYMTSTNFLDNDLDKVIQYIEEKLYKKI